MSPAFIISKFGENHRMLRWTTIGGTPTTVARRSRFAPRTRFCIFFKTTDPVLIHHVDRGDTIDHRYYIDNCLESLIEEIRKQKLTSGTHAIKLHHDNAKLQML